MCLARGIPCEDLGHKYCRGALSSRQFPNAHGRRCIKLFLRRSYLRSLVSMCFGLAPVAVVLAVVGRPVLTLIGVDWRSTWLPSGDGFDPF